MLILLNCIIITFIKFPLELTFHKEQNTYLYVDPLSKRAMSAETTGSSILSVINHIYTTIQLAN